ncbi:MAG: type II toxin-antitoxin system RatA family toxin [Candidatus Geothermarchaeales archaeon]
MRPKTSWTRNSVSGGSSARIEMSIEVKAPPEKVFALITDVERYPERFEGYENVEVTSESRKGMFMTYRVHETRENRYMERYMECTDWVEDERFAFRMLAGPFGMEFEGAFELRPIKEGTQVTLVYECVLPEDWGMGEDVVARITEGFLEKMKGLLEEGT